MSEGKFTEDGMYIDNKFAGYAPPIPPISLRPTPTNPHLRPAETRDAWLEEVDSNDKKRKDKGEKIEDVKNVEIADFDKDDDELDILALKRDVLECLLPGESVSKALKRLRGSGKKPTDAGVLACDLVVCDVHDACTEVLAERGGVCAQVWGISIS